jgi:hypothetical protein
MRFERSFPLARSGAHTAAVCGRGKATEAVFNCCWAPMRASIIAMLARRLCTRPPRVRMQTWSICSFATEPMSHCWIAGTVCHSSMLLIATTIRSRSRSSTRARQSPTQSHCVERPPSRQPSLKCYVHAKSTFASCATRPTKRHVTLLPTAAVCPMCFACWFMTLASMSTHVTTLDKRVRTFVRHMTISRRFSCVWKPVSALTLPTPTVDRRCTSLAWNTTSFVRGRCWLREPTWTCKTTRANLRCISSSACADDNTERFTTACAHWLQPVPVWDALDFAGNSTRSLASHRGLWLPAVDDIDTANKTPGQIEGDRRRVAAAREEVAVVRGKLISEQFLMLRKRGLEICMALGMLKISTLEMCEILFFACPRQQLVPFHLLWALAKTVRHFHDRNKSERSTMSNSSL